MQRIQLRKIYSIKDNVAETETCLDLCRIFMRFRYIYYLFLNIFSERITRIIDHLLCKKVVVNILAVKVDTLDDPIR